MRCIPMVLLLTLFSTSQAQDPAKVIRVGIIGCDTSHVIAFTKILNNPNNTGDLEGVKVVAAYPGGSPDLPESINRVSGYVASLKKEYQVEIVDSIPALLAKVDAVLLESVDGRPHWEQVQPVLRAKKPVFIDKPMAGSLVDAMRIFHLSRETGTPCFSSSALRFTPNIAGARKNEKVGVVTGCLAWSPCALNRFHPDLYWYGIHGVETLYTSMGTGCVAVQRTSVEGADIVTGVWNDGRVGIFRGIRSGQHDFGAVVFGSKGVVNTGGFSGYDPLVVEIARFFRTRKVPVSIEETLEILAFMEAADASKKAGGMSVKLADVVAKAREQLR
jgi:predicted dehydrogenase